VAFATPLPKALCAQVKTREITRTIFCHNQSNDAMHAASADSWSVERQSDAYHLYGA